MKNRLIFRQVVKMMIWYIRNGKFVCTIFIKNLYSEIKD